jgi:Peptidase family M1 domain
LAIVFVTSTCYAQNKYWQQQVNFTIDVSLNDVEHTLTGYEKIDYTNNSPDTIFFIWFHLWPNAFKNDKTAYSDQVLQNGSTDFYFSNAEKKGYINQLEFKQQGNVCATQEHPQHQDIIKVILPQPLPPNKSCKIETPFFVKLPYTFSRLGHVDQSYQITQWYPKPAVYDKEGWHEMAYLNQGEFYSEIGDYNVQITLPKNYLVASTGQLQNAEEEKILQERYYNKITYTPSDWKVKNKKSESKYGSPPSSKETKTISYSQKNIHDFAWFADKRFNIKKDTLTLQSGRIIDVFNYYFSSESNAWQNSMNYTKTAIQSKSKLVGEYPYDVVSVVEDASDKGGGMEYPTITLLSSGGSPEALASIIFHEVGHNWFYGILANNEKQHPWMDEGLNTYYDNRHSEENINQTSKNSAPKFIKNRIPLQLEATILQNIITAKRDQPIATAASIFSENNYNYIPYTKAGDWVKLLATTMGEKIFDTAMHQYFLQWQFKHPSPIDFNTAMQNASDKNLDTIFSLLHKKGNLIPTKKIKKIRLTSFFNFNNTDKFNYISIAPIIGFNFYDKLMLGALIHNYSLIPSKFQFFIAPLFAKASNQFNATGKMSYTNFLGKSNNKIIYSIAGNSFSNDKYTDSTNTNNYLQFFKIVPSVKIIFPNKNPRSLIEKYVQWKLFLIQEQGLIYKRDPVTQIENIEVVKTNRYINQLKLGISNARALYPYNGDLQIDQGDNFIRAGATGNYFFNYPKGGGLNLRMFVGKFFYTSPKTYIKQFQTDIYHLNLSGPKGYEDYTYSNYYVSRNQFREFTSQQMMERDGFFKVRTDLLSNKVGKTDNWLAAVNLTTTIPKEINPLEILPFKIPIKLFFDLGTYAEAWKKNANTAKFLYDAGIQISLLKNILNVYVPLVYSRKVYYLDYFKPNFSNETGIARLLKNITFTIDVQRIKAKSLLPNFYF